MFVKPFLELPGSILHSQVFACQEVVHIRRHHKRKRKIPLVYIPKFGLGTRIALHQRLLVAGGRLVEQSKLDRVLAEGRYFGVGFYVARLTQTDAVWSLHAFHEEL